MSDSSGSRRRWYEPARLVLHFREVLLLTVHPLEVKRMTTKSTYDPARTGLLFVDPYNDFLSEGGKLWPRVKEVAEQVGLIENLKAVIKTVREKSIQVFIVPHHSWEPGDYERWKHANPSQLASARYQLVAKGT